MNTQKSKTTALLHPWDVAKKIKVVRGGYGYPTADLEPGVKFFVLMLEQIGAATLYSCEGHPRGFYVMFRCPYETALSVKKCGFLEVTIFDADTWTIRTSESQRITSPRRKAELLRWAAESWERNLGKLRLPK